MRNLNEDLKNNIFKNMYLLYGEESYLKRLYKNKLKSSLVSVDDTMNHSYYEGKGINPNEIIDLAETMPFFAERRVIIIENSGFFKEKCDELADYLDSCSETTCFIFVENEVDKRGRLFKKVKDKGRTVELNYQDENSLTKWILGLLKKENKKITQNAMQLFLAKTGTDMENIHKELEKLICYVGERESISESDINTICTTRISNNIFDMVSAVAEKKQKQALDLYYDLLALKEPPMRILFLITRQFNLLLQIKDLKRLGFSSSDIAKKIGLPGFVVNKYVSQSTSFSVEWLKSALNSCAETEESVKTGRINDVMSLELLIINFSG
ncbi:DNA polymerase III subunit delta [Candidatus Galacturonibacter soehngenii]|uniref:DNA polymerase III subunit delta n=1 Tax=Candidatus Galacturonatibacter soehngenii TaxID=2307010 RepID=A0A7V7UFN6_9FIRM|nr:DNA polymerase III subunit delta [Candidatus Galacturonibacter soehngenii]KAB1437666.1 DNA polymerase III subunit delta [Candidatus Galacturonibacter soehngenii]MBA4686893.1 DNA polymerase III subunit delta [Candidatus Galacturonibacter soehngenii]